MKKNNYLALITLVAITIIAIPLLFKGQATNAPGEQLAGNFLLQVEDKGQVWYVAPNDSKRYELTIDNALEVLMNVGDQMYVEEINKGPINYNRGEILVDENQQVWYISFSGEVVPVNQGNLLDIFNTYAIGISDAELSLVEVGSQ